MKKKNIILAILGFIGLFNIFSQSNYLNVIPKGIAHRGRQMFEDMEMQDKPAVVISRKNKAESPKGGAAVAVGVNPRAVEDVSDNEKSILPTVKGYDKMAVFAGANEGGSGYYVDVSTKEARKNHSDYIEEREKRKREELAEEQKQKVLREELAEKQEQKVLMKVVEGSTGWNALSKEKQELAVRHALHEQRNYPMEDIPASEMKTGMIGLINKYFYTTDEDGYHIPVGHLDEEDLEHFHIGLLVEYLTNLFGSKHGLKEYKPSVGSVWGDYYEEDVYHPEKNKTPKSLWSNSLKPVTETPRYLYHNSPHKLSVKLKFEKAKSKSLEKSAIGENARWIESDYDDYFYPKNPNHFTNTLKKQKKLVDDTYFYLLSHNENQKEKRRMQHWGTSLQF